MSEDTKIFESGRDQVLIDALKSLIGDDPNTVIRSSQTVDLTECDSLGVLYMAVRQRSEEFSCIGDMLVGKMLFRQALNRGRALELIEALKSVSMMPEPEVENVGLRKRIASVFKGK